MDEETGVQEKDFSWNASVYLQSTQVGPCLSGTLETKSKGLEEIQNLVINNLLWKRTRKRIYICVYIYTHAYIYN